MTSEAGGHDVAALAAGAATLPGGLSGSGAAQVGSDDAAPLAWHRRLAAERERQGLSQPDVAARLRLHPRQVAAMETGDLTRLPTGTYLRGFVRNYALALGLDPAAIVAGLESAAGRAAVPAARVVLAGGAPPGRPGEGRSRVLVVGGALLVLGVFAFAGWWTSRQSALNVERTPAQAARPAVALLPESQAPAPGAAPAAADSGAASATPAAPSAVDPVAADSVAPPAGASRAAASPGNPVGGAASGVVRLRFQVGQRPAWIEVVDARGQLLVADLHRPGGERTVDGRGPLRVTVGNAASVQMEAHGRQVDLRPHMSANEVARLTVE